MQETKMHLSFQKTMYSITLRVKALQ